MIIFVLSTCLFYDDRFQQFCSVISKIGRVLLTAHKHRLKHNTQFNRFHEKFTNPGYASSDQDPNLLIIDLSTWIYYF